MLPLVLNGSKHIYPGFESQFQLASHVVWVNVHLHQERRLIKRKTISVHRIQKLGGPESLRFSDLFNSLPTVCLFFQQV
jgi:hypothetical protein